MEFISLQITIFFIIFLISLIFLRRTQCKKTSAHGGFIIYPLVGVLPSFLINRHRFHDWLTGILSLCPTNTAVYSRPGGIRGVVTANPQIVEHMLKSHFANYPKGTLFITIMQDLLGTGIFNSDSELWRTQRKTASYEFSSRSLRNFAMENVTRELQTRLVPILENAARTDRVLDFQVILERFAFDNICQLGFNFDPACLGGDGAEFMRAFDDAVTLSSARFLYVFPTLYTIKKFLNLGSEKKLKKSIAIVHEFADKIIRTRMQERHNVKAEKKGEDLLSRFMGNNENNISPKFLRDMIINFILAGRDSSSSALSWFFWLLSSRQDVQEKILQELKNIRRKKSKKSETDFEIYSFDDLREMHYLHAAISESMRLYPPIPVDTKHCLEDDVLPDGTFIGENWLISYDAYAMGRMESIWGKDCCDYKPERWIENGICKRESPFKYPIFHGGPRMCLGKDMAYIQMKSIAATVLERFSFDVLMEKGKCPQQWLSLTLRMKDGLPVRVKERN